MEQKRKISAALTAAAMMTVIGAGAAEAQTQPKAGDTAQVNAQSNPKPKPKHCIDIDSTATELTTFEYVKYVSAVCDGKVYVLSVNETTPTLTDSEWKFVGGPTDVIDVTLASNTEGVVPVGPTVYVTVLTKKGKVWEGTCPGALPLGPCEWTQLTNPPQ
ncbi:MULTISPECIES: hypothetical protein [unclassified Streptomyces]|uniref:hypothetical protein n=1 Tax=unclassified Streptomyces TaxID=2593676 RepID=UPI003646E869